MSLFDLPYGLQDLIINFTYNIYDCNEIPIIFGPSQQLTKKQLQHQLQITKEIKSLSMISKDFYKLISNYRSFNTISKQLKQYEFMRTIVSNDLERILYFLVTNKDRDYICLSIYGLLDVPFLKPFDEYSYEIISKLLILDESLSFDAIEFSCSKCEYWLPIVNNSLKVYANQGYKIFIKLIEFTQDKIYVDYPIPYLTDEWSDKDVKPDFRNFFTIIKEMSDGKCIFGRSSIICKKCDKIFFYFDDKTSLTHTLPCPIKWKRNNKSNHIKCNYCSSSYDIDELCSDCINTCGCYDCKYINEWSYRTYKCDYACDNCISNFRQCSLCDVSFSENCNQIIYHDHSSDNNYDFYSKNYFINNLTDDYEF